MARTNTRASPGGLSRWPRILFLGTVALGFAVLTGLWAYGLAVNKDVSPNAAGTVLLIWIGLGTFLLPAGVLALLLAISVTRAHQRWHPLRPRRHRRTTTLSPT